MISKPVRVSQKNPDRIPIIKTLHEPDGGGGQREDELAEARQAMGGDDPAPPTPTFEPVRRPSPAYGLPRGNLVAGGCRQGERERARVSEQTRTAQGARWGRPGLPPGTPCSSRPRPCTWSTAAAAARAPCRTPRCRTRARRRRPRAWRRRPPSWTSQPRRAARRFPSTHPRPGATGGVAERGRLRRARRLTHPSWDLEFSLPKLPLTN